MHRVELKGLFCLWFYQAIRPVPNAPCGVERIDKENLSFGFPKVPNAPCGVESACADVQVLITTSVPNAPCGVERKVKAMKPAFVSVFLMHRVELKAYLWMTTANG